MDSQKSILAIDIGGGTQDVLVYDPDKTIENCFKLVLPSPTVLIKDTISKLTKANVPIHLTGTVMGGGPSVRAIKDHLKQGLAVTATAEAAKTIYDDLCRVEAMGVVLKESAPADAEAVEMGDLDLPRFKQLFDLYQIPMPDMVAVAVQDHGEAIGESNRIVRSRHWQQLIESGGNPLDLVYSKVPEHLTRMHAVKKAYSDAILMDTGPAAILGALCDPVVAEHQQKGVVVVNIGNMHTLAFLIKENRIFGMFEHHTKMIDTDKLAQLLKRLQLGQITQDEIYNDGGHGGSISSAGLPSSFDFIAVTGPNRHLAKKINCYQAVPHGDMMLSGCFGLIEGVHALNSL